MRYRNCSRKGIASLIERPLKGSPATKLWNKIVLSIANYLLPSPYGNEIKEFKKLKSQIDNYEMWPYVFKLLNSLKQYETKFYIQQAVIEKRADPLKERREFLLKKYKQLI